MRTPSLLLAALVIGAAPVCAEPITSEAFRALPRPAPAITVAYGPARSQAIDVYVPQGRGPFPVAVLIHGGCWKASVADRVELRNVGAALAARGILAWNIGYRRVLMSQLLNDNRIKDYVREILEDEGRLPAPEGGATEAKRPRLLGTSGAVGNGSTSA